MSKEENYVPGFIGLRRLYDEGQYYTVTSIEQNRYDVRVHHADGSVADLFERVDDKRKTRHCVAKAPNRFSLNWPIS